MLYVLKPSSKIGVKDKNNDSSTVKKYCGPNLCYAFIGSDSFATQVQHLLLVDTAFSYI